MLLLFLLQFVFNKLYVIGVALYSVVVVVFFLISVNKRIVLKEGLCYIVQSLLVLISLLLFRRRG